MSKFLSFLFLIIFGFSLQAQMILKGTIRDSINKETLVGANVVIDGTTQGVSTDIDGNFIIKTDKTNFDIAISFVSYKAKKIKINTRNKDTICLMNILLIEDIKCLNQVNIVSNRSTHTDIATLLEVKKADQIAVAVSGQQIAKSADRDAAQIMKRVSGVQLMNERFVMIRGLNERYNTVMLNNSLAPSSEIDNRSFSFDLVPSGIIDRMVVYKSPSSDLPAEMGAGVIKIFTKSQVDENKITFGFSLGYRTGVSFSNVLDYKGGKTDFLGFDDGTRKLNDNLSSRSILNGNDRNLANQKFSTLNPYYDVSQKKVLPDFRLNFGLQRKFNIKNIKAGNITHFYYSNSNSLPTNAYQNRYEGINNDELSQSWSDKNYGNTVKLGMISNFNFYVSPKLSFDFKNFINKQSLKETMMRDGYNHNEEIYYRNYAYRYESKFLYSTQISMKYEINEKSKIDAIIGYNYVNRNEPDFRRFSTSTSNISSDAIFKVDIPQVSNPSLSQGSRFWSSMNEHEVMGGLNAEHLIGKKQGENTMKIRYGLLGEYKSRTFDARWFGYINPNNTNIENLTPEEVFSPNNLTNGSGLSMNEGTNYDDEYQARNINVSAYINYTLPIGEKFITNIGVRAEWNRQELQSKLRGSGALVNVDNPILSVLPSINTTYNFNEKHLLKLAYGLSLNRPEFRELAPFSYYDFELNIAKTGNPDLKTSIIHNADIRYEYYPSKTEFVSIGVFYKYFVNPIEAMGRASGSGTSFYFTNPESAYSTGLEIEIKKNIPRILKEKLQIYANAALILSQVNASNLQGQLSKRPLQGQSPYLINAGLYYNGKVFYCNVLYNIFGKRIYVVGDNLGNETIYELPRHSLDFSIGKTFFQKIDCKISITDILNANYLYKTENNLVWRSIQKGTSISLGINYIF